MKSKLIYRFKIWAISLLKFLCYILICFSFKLTYANTDINHRINQILKEDDLVDNLNISIEVIDLHSDEKIYVRNPFQAMTPASVAKSFVAMAALEYLKPDFVYKTQMLFDDSKINKQRVLSEDIYFKFSGDPSLTAKDIEQLIKKLTDYNIKEINADIVIYDSIFDHVYRSPGSAWDDNKFCFAAPTSAIIINKNCFNMQLSKDKSNHRITKLTAIDTIYAYIENKIKISENDDCYPELKASLNNHYELSGCLNSNSSDIFLNIAYQNPQLLVKDLIIDLLKQNNINFIGNIKFEELHKPFPVVFEHTSIPLKDLISQMMKDSDNLSANSFLKTIGAKYYNTKGTFANGIKATKKILSSINNINFNQMRLVDGSGESRYNLVSVDQLVSLYKKAYYNIDFYNSLPILGIDGTLKSTQSTILKEIIRAKTGSMSGVTSIAGYIEKDLEKPLVFAITINGLGSRSQHLNLIEKILEELAK